MTKSSSEKASAYLDKCITGALNDGTGELPYITVLAKAAGVSLPVMKKAVEEYIVSARLFLDGRRLRPVESMTVSQKAAYGFICEKIRSLQENGLRRLPTTQVMARGAGVSPVTMARAVRLLCESGILQAVRRQGIQIREAAGARPAQPQPQPADDPPAGGTAWRRIVARADKDILNGRYAPGDLLPDTKQLCSRYGVSYRTMSKALSALNADGRIVKRGRAYAVPDRHQAGRGGAVVLVARGTPDGRFYVLSSRTVEGLKALEDRCSRAGIELVVAVVNDNGISLRLPCARFSSLADVFEGKSVLGFLIWTMGLGGFDPQAVILQLAVHRKPIAVFDEDGGIAFPSVNAPLRIFSLGHSSQPGRQVGRYLLGLGHRRTAYVSANHDQPYSRNRLIGLQSACMSAGVPDGVSAFAAELSAQEGSIDEPGAALDIITRLQETGWLGPPGIGDLPDAVLSEIRWRHIIEIRRRQSIRQVLYPLFDRVMTTPGITALVAENDLTAVEAIHYLQMKGLRVPGDISIVGFDDSAPASTFNLTSYNFNISAVMTAMLDFVLSPRRFGDGGRACTPVEIEGYITMRESAGAVKR